MKRVSSILLCCLWLLPTSSIGQEQSIDLSITADNSIIDVRGERDFNMGRASAIRLKSFQHHLILNFDSTPLRGRSVISARLRYAQKDHDFPRVTISTIQAPWGEGDSTGFRESEGGSTYNHARHPGTPWAWPGSRFPDVVYGNSFSLMVDADSEVSDDGYYSWNLDPRLVQAHAVGAAYGLAVFESESNVGRNPTVYSKEQADRAPYLQVELGPAIPAPAQIDDLRADESAADGSEIVLRFTVPERAFAYDVLFNGEPAPRYLIPFAGPAGSEQLIRLRDIVSPGAAAEIEVTPISGSGARGAPTNLRVAAHSPAVMPHPEFAETPPEDGMVYRHAGLQVWAFPETDLLLGDGRFLEAVGENYRARNGRFHSGKVVVSGARGETVAFMLALEAEAQPVPGLGVVINPPNGIGASLAAIRSIDVGEGPRPEIIDRPSGAAPVTELTGLATNGDPGDANSQVALVLVDLTIPLDAGPGVQEGSVLVRHESGDLRIPLTLEVHDFEIPSQPRFHMELNTYGWPDAVPTLWALQDVAHQYRSYVNVVPYNHNGRIRFDMLRTNGQRQDEQAFSDFEVGDTEGHWDPEFIEAFAPILSGDAFGNGAAVGGFYLPFHENWPLPMNEFRIGESLDAYSVFPQGYGQTFSDILSHFAATAAEQGWTETTFQVYLNNKPGPNNPTPWTLDEPSGYWDFRALDYFGSLFDAANTDLPGIDLVYRVDISRPQYHRGMLDRIGLYVCAGGAADIFPRIVVDQQRRLGNEVWTYGAANAVGTSNHFVQAWAARTFALGGRGLLPWQSVQSGADLLEGRDSETHRLGLVLITEDSLTPRVYPSLRLAAFRRAQQDMEYLHELQARGDYSRAQMASLIRRHLGLDEADQSVEAATEIPSDGYTEAHFDALRAHAAAAIKVLNRESGTDAGVTDDVGIADGGVQDGQGDSGDPLDGGAQGDRGVPEACDSEMRGQAPSGAPCTVDIDCQCDLVCTSQDGNQVCQQEQPTSGVGDTDDSGGCGCRSHSSGNPFTAGLLIVALLWFRRRQ